MWRVFPAGFILHCSPHFAAPDLFWRNTSNEDYFLLVQFCCCFNDIFQALKTSRLYLSKAVSSSYTSLILQHVWMGLTQAGASLYHHVYCFKAEAGGRKYAHAKLQLLNYEIIISLIKKTSGLKDLNVYAVAGTWVNWAWLYCAITDSQKPFSLTLQMLPKSVRLLGCDAFAWPGIK